MIQSPARQGPRTTLGSRFHRLWAASAASNLGDGVWLVAAPLLAATLTRDPMAIAGLAVAQRLPWLLFPLIGGALADRVDRRRTMVGVALARAALVCVLGASVVLGAANLPLMYAVFFLVATGETLFDTSAAALLPAVVPAGQLPKANARLSSTAMVANQFVGPPLGGALFAASAALPFAFGAGGLVLAASALATLRGSFRADRGERPPAGDLRAEIAEGVRWLWEHRLLRTLAWSMGLLNLTLVAQVSIMVLFAEERLGLGPEGYGALIAAYGIGGALGGLVAERVLGFVGEARYLRLAIVFEAVVPAAIALASDGIAVGAALALFGVHAVVWGSVLAALRQELTPDRLRGRIASIHGLIEYGGAAPGALLGGILASAFGLTAPFWLGAVVGVALIPFVWPIVSDEAVTTARAEAAAG